MCSLVLLNLILPSSDQFHVFISLPNLNLPLQTSCLMVIISYSCPSFPGPYIRKVAKMLASRFLLVHKESFFFWRKMVKVQQIVFRELVTLLCTSTSVV